MFHILSIYIINKFKYIYKLIYTSFHKNKSYIYTHTYLVAFFRLIIPIWIWKMDMASCFLHHLFNIITTFTYHMRMFCMRNIHLQGYPVALEIKHPWLDLLSAEPEYFMMM